MVPSLDHLLANFKALAAHLKEDSFITDQKHDRTFVILWKNLYTCPLGRLQVEPKLESKILRDFQFARVLNT